MPGEPVPVLRAKLELVVVAASQQRQRPLALGRGFGVLAANGQPGDREEFSAFVVATLAEPGDATIVCETTGGWESGNVTDATLAAVSLQP